MHYFAEVNYVVRGRGRAASIEPIPLEQIFRFKHIFNLPEFHSNLLKIDFYRNLLIKKTGLDKFSNLKIVSNKNVFY